MPDSAKTTVALYHGRSVFVTNGFYGFDGLAPGAFQTGESVCIGSIDRCSCSSESSSDKGGTS